MHLGRTRARAPRAARPRPPTIPSDDGRHLEGQDARDDPLSASWRAGTWGTTPPGGGVERVAWVMRRCSASNHLGDRERSAITSEAGLAFSVGSPESSDLWIPLGTTRNEPARGRKNASRSDRSQSVADVIHPGSRVSSRGAFQGSSLARLLDRWCSSRLRRLVADSLRAGGGLLVDALREARELIQMHSEDRKKENDVAEVTDEIAN